MIDLTRIRAGAFALALCLGGTAADADMLGLSRSAAGELAQSVAGLIARNDVLRRLSEVDPDLARLLAIRLMELSAQEGVPAGGDGEIDEAGDAADPDIERLRRSSPEAVLDLIELMEKASRAR